MVKNVLILDLYDFHWILDILDSWNFNYGEVFDISHFIDKEKLIYDKISNSSIKYFCIVTKDESLAKDFSNNVIRIDKDLNDKDKIRICKEIRWTMTNFGKDKQMDDNVYVIGDPHFYHKNIIRYCNRPWYSNVDENGKPLPTDEDAIRMNEDMIASWNSVITSNSQIVYVNGDFCFGNKEKVKSVFDRLNGTKRLLLGNHDNLKFKDYYEIGFDRVYDKPILLDGFCILSHAPIQWVKDGDVYMNVYAHVHTQEFYKDYTANSFCTSAERINYKPIKFVDIYKKCMSLQ